MIPCLLFFYPKTFFLQMLLRLITLRDIFCASGSRNMFSSSLAILLGFLLLFQYPLREGTNKRTNERKLIYLLITLKLSDVPTTRRANEQTFERR